MASSGSMETERLGCTLFVMRVRLLPFEQQYQAENRKSLLIFACMARVRANIAEVHAALNVFLPGLAVAGRGETPHVINHGRPMRRDPEENAVA